MRHKFKNRVFRCSNTVKRLRKWVATLLAKALQQGHRSTANNARGGIHAVGIGRKYLNAAERRRFLEIAASLNPQKRLFCVLLTLTGARISEMLAVSPSCVDLDAGTVIFETLKRRRRGIIRQLPLPSEVLSDLDHTFGIRNRLRLPGQEDSRLWPWSRSTAWRLVKRTMSCADIRGTPAMPKGLRHGFGVAAFAVVPPHLVQRWLGHASFRTTALYGDVIGPEERAFAERIWQLSKDDH